MPKGLIIRNTGEIEDFNHENTYHDLQRIVDGYFEAIHFGNKNYFCYSNEESKLIKLPQNRIVTDLWYDSGQMVLIGDYIAGDVIFFGLPDGEGEDTDYPEQLRLDLERYLPKF